MRTIPLALIAGIGLLAAACGAPSLHQNVASSLQQEVATNLDNYAALLRQTGQSAQASVMTARAGRIHEATRRAPKSTYLGFNPSEVLRKYAALLQKRGREPEAKKMEALAKRWKRDNYEGFLKMQREFNR